MVLQPVTTLEVLRSNLTGLTNPQHLVRPFFWEASQREEAMRYIQEHNLESVLNDFINRVAVERPEDPILTLENRLCAAATAKLGIEAVEAEPYSINGFLYGVQVTVRTHISTRSCTTVIEPQCQLADACSTYSYENAKNAATLVHTKLSHRLKGIDPQNQKRIDEVIEEFCESLSSSSAQFNLAFATSFASLLAGMDTAGYSMRKYVTDKFMIKDLRKTLCTVCCPIISPSISSENPVLAARAIGYLLEITPSSTDICNTLTSLITNTRFQLEEKNILSGDIDSSGTFSPTLSATDVFGPESDASAAKKKGAKKGKSEGDIPIPLVLVHNGMKCLHQSVKGIGAGKTFIYGKAGDLVVTKETLQKEEEQQAGGKDKKKGGKGKGISATDLNDESVVYDINARTQHRPTHGDNAPPIRDVNTGKALLEGFAHIIKEVSSLGCFIDPLAAEDSEDWGVLASATQTMENENEENTSPRSALSSFSTCASQCSSDHNKTMLALHEFNTVSSLISTAQACMERTQNLGLNLFSITPVKEEIADFLYVLGFQTILLPGVLRHDSLSLVTRLHTLITEKSQQTENIRSDTVDVEEHKEELDESEEAHPEEEDAKDSPEEA